MKSWLGENVAFFEIVFDLFSHRDKFDMQMELMLDLLEHDEYFKKYNLQSFTLFFLQFTILQLQSVHCPPDYSF
jgi:hypothetical protein